jgi:prevent-host-death family protein
MKTITKEQATSSFADVMQEVTAGEEVLITEGGTPVARITPLRRQLTGAAREQAIKSMMENLRNSGLKLGGRRFTRDEMHER